MVSCFFLVAMTKLKGSGILSILCIVSNKWTEYQECSFPKQGIIRMTEVA